MRKPSRVSFRGLTPQLFLLVVLPLAGLLLAVTFGGVSLHRGAMRQMVAERDQRAAEAAASTLGEQLDHRLKAIQGLAQGPLGEDGTALQQLLAGFAFLQPDFDGGLAYFSPGGERLASTGERAQWEALTSVLFAGDSPVRQENTTQSGLLAVEYPAGHSLYLAWARNPASQVIAAGAFSPEKMVASTFASQGNASQDGGDLFIIDQQRRVVFQTGTVPDPGVLQNHFGVAEALAGKSGAGYLGADQEHVVAYSPVPISGWALVMEEPWESVATPELRLTEYAPLILLPVLAISLLAVWFGTSRIVQPLLKLQGKASRLGWGDYAAIEEPVGGINEIRQLQAELAHLAHKVEASQKGLRDYIGAMTAGQEEERRRLARDLHDDTLQSLIALNQRAQLLSLKLSRLPENGHVSEDVAALEALTGETIANLRRLTRALRPIYLEDLGLATALQMLAQEFSDPNLEIDFKLSGHLPRLQPEVELALYRMTQEALSNVTRHAKANWAWVTVSVGEGTAKIEIRDNGQGFSVPESPAEFAPSGHFGLLGLHERAEMIGAKLQIASKPGQGTHLSIQLPIASAEEGA